VAKAKEKTVKKDAKLLKLFDTTLETVKIRITELRETGLQVSEMETAIGRMGPHRKTLENALAEGDTETINLIVNILKKLTKRVQEAEDTLTEDQKEKSEQKKSVEKMAAEAPEKVVQEVEVQAIPTPEEVPSAPESEPVAEPEPIPDVAPMPEDPTPAAPPDNSAEVNKLLELVSHLETRLTDLEGQLQQRPVPDMSELTQKIAMLTSKIQSVEQDKLPALSGQVSSTLSQVQASLEQVKAQGASAQSTEALTALQEDMNAKLRAIAQAIKKDEHDIEETRTTMQQLQAGLNNVVGKMSESTGVQSKFAEQIKLLAQMSQQLDQKLEREQAADHQQFEEIRKKLLTVKTQVVKAEPQPVLSKSSSDKQLNDLFAKMELLEGSIKQDQMRMDLVSDELGDKLSELAKLRKELQG